jgi:hypothetical protein
LFYRSSRSKIMFNPCITQKNETVFNNGGFGGILCPQPPVFYNNQQTSYNNPQISQKMKYAQYIRSQSSR